MKARRLVLCLFLSLALIVTFIPIISFADENGGEDDVECGTIELDSGWVQDEDDPARWTDSDGDVIEFSGTFYNTEYGFAAEVGETVFMHVYPAEGQQVASVYFNDEILTPDEESGSYSFVVCADYDDGYDWEAGNYIKAYFEENEVASISYTPVGQHYATINCTSIIDYPYWNVDLALGDKITVNYAEGSTVTYVCKEVTYTEYGEEYTDWEFVNVSDDSDYLQWWPYFDLEVPYASYKSGDKATIKTNVVCNSVKTASPVSVNVEFVFYHEEYWDSAKQEYVSPLKKTNAVAATCTAAGNIDYWQCQRCNKYFKDGGGEYEIASGAWAISATGHKFTKSKVTKKAGLLKNGTKVEVCSVCGANGKTTVIPGWSKYYVKAPKTVAGKKSFTVKWGKQSKANLKKFTGYQIRYSTKKSMAKAKMVKVKKTATSQTVKKLKKKTKYFVQVRTYTKKSGKLFYSKWSAKKTVKTK